MRLSGYFDSKARVGQCHPTSLRSRPARFIITSHCIRSTGLPSICPHTIVAHLSFESLSYLWGQSPLVHHLNSKHSITNVSASVTPPRNIC